MRNASKPLIPPIPDNAGDVSDRYSAFQDRFKGVEAAYPADTGQCSDVSDRRSAFQDRFKGRRSFVSEQFRTILSALELAATLRGAFTDELF